MKKQIALSFKSVTILLIFLSSVVACSGPQAEDLANSTENGSFNDQSSGGGSEEVGVGPENPGEGDDPTPTAPTTPEIRTARWEGVSGGRAWTIFTYQTLKDYTPALFTLAPRDVASFCPNYSNLDEYERRDFWVYLISAMAYFESGFDPSTDYREAFNDSHGNPVISKGLLQISDESARGYGCAVANTRSLYDPEINLDCTIRILKRWVDRDGVISGKSGSRWRGGARYWAVLRKTSTLSNIKAWTRSQSYCR